MLHDATPQETLRVLRGRRDWTLRKAADALGCTHAHLSNVETGKAHPGLNLAVSIERVFEIPVMAWVAQPEPAEVAS
jgi:DNA-binding XRE family transcriptional regulator